MCLYSYACLLEEDEKIDGYPYGLTMHHFVNLIKTDACLPIMFNRMSLLDYGYSVAVDATYSHHI